MRGILNATCNPRFGVCLRTQKIASGAEDPLFFFAGGADIRPIECLIEG
jgi:hypothetical protein